MIWNEKFHRLELMVSSNETSFAIRRDKFRALIYAFFFFGNT